MTGNRGWSSGKRRDWRGRERRETLKRRARQTLEGMPRRRERRKLRVGSETPDLVLGVMGAQNLKR